MVEASLIQQTKEFSRAHITRIITPGPDRTTPFCPHFDTCGGCSLQHLSDTAYRAFKTRVVRDAMAHAGFADVACEMVFLPRASRRRVEFHVSQSRLAFFGLRSKTLMPVEQCPILVPKLQALISPLNALLAEISQVLSVNLTAADRGVDVFLRMGALGNDARAAMKSFAETHDIARVCVQLSDGSIRTIVQRAPVLMCFGNDDIPLPPEAFLQPTQEGQRALTQFAIENSAGAKQIADLFCGLGTYSLPLRAKATVHAVENDATMIAALANHPGNKLTTERRDLFIHPLSAQELARFDTVLLNPPRAGAKTQCEELARSSVKKVIMISCNPASFARDIKLLKESGFTMQKCISIDQFSYSPHIELACVLTRA